MKRQKLQQAKALQIEVTWYDNVPEPPRVTTFEGEVIGWRESQVIVRVKEYAVVRFWKHNGMEVGNADGERRGLKVDWLALAESVKPDPGVEVSFTGETDEVPPLPPAA